MLCEKVIGNLSDNKFNSLKVDFIDIQWHETYKKLHRKISHSGKEFAIKLDNDILVKGLKQGDVLYVDDKIVVAVNILPCDAIVINIDENHKNQVAKVCYEIGNKHAALFRGKDDFEFMTPYNEPMLKLLQKIHGVTAHIDNVKFDFNKSISSTVNSHTH